MKPVSITTAVAVLGILAAAATPGEARENRVLKCSTEAARRQAAPVGPALLANVPRAMTPIDLNAVQMTDKGLARKMLVEGLFAMRTPTDTVQVVARVVNCTGKTVSIEARSSFMNNAQIPTEPVSTWKTVHVPAYGTGVYEERSMARQDVSYYLVEMRQAQ